MPPENRSSAEEPFRELDTQLAALRAAAKSLREERPSRADNLLHPGRRARQEADFGAAVVAALKEIGASVRNALAQQESKLADLEANVSELEANLSELGRQLSDLRGEQLKIFQNELDQFRDQQERLVREQAAAVANANERATELRQQVEQVEQFGRDQVAKIEQLAAGQTELANEFRERIQHLLDEQRVSIRQLALKASEDAVLADRARRATELKLEELANRVSPPPPA